MFNASSSAWELDVGKLSQDFVKDLLWKWRKVVKIRKQRLDINKDRAKSVEGF
jgi:hypothetical protein